MSPRLVPPAAVSGNTVYLSSHQIRARFGGRGELWVYRQIARNGFPKPVKFGSGRLNYWKLSEVEAWEAAQAQRVA